MGTLTPKHVHLHPGVFFQFHLEQRWSTDRCKLDVICNEQLKIEVKLLLSANRKPYMPHRLVQQQMTLRDLEWPFHASHAMSAVAELLVFRKLRSPLHNVSLFTI